MVRILAARPADVDAPEGRCAAVGQLSQAVPSLAMCATRRLAVSAREADTGPDLEAEADALLLVGVDAVTAPGRDVLEAEEVMHDVERCSAVLAEVETWIAVRSGWR